MIILKAGSLEKEIVTLQSKDQEESLYYEFSLENRIGDQTIKSVSWTATANGVDISDTTIDKQIFKCLISGGTVYTNIGITFKIITSAGETRTFNCVLPIRPQGVMETENSNTVIIVGGGNGAQEKGSLSLEIGTVTTLAPDEKATAEIVHGADGKDTLDLGLVKGDKGDTGAQGPQGEKGDTGATGDAGGYTTEDQAQVQSIIDAFQVGENKSTLKDVNSSYTRVSSTSTTYFTYTDQSLWQGKTISQIGFNVSTAGTLTVMLTENPNNADFKVIKQSTINLILGQQWYDLNWFVGEDQYISIVDSSDIGRFTYSQANSSVGLFYYYTPTTKVWGKSASDLNMGVKIDNYKPASLYPLLDKTVSFLGDSITTFGGYNPSGYATKYPLSDVTQVKQTWWEQFIDLTGATLLDNNSYSASRVSSGGNGSLQTRLTGIDAGTDICLIFMGTNDLGNGVTFGDFDPTKTTFDTSQFTDALCNAIVNLQTNYPTTKFVWMTPLKRFVSTTNNVQYSNSSQTVDTYTDRIIEVCNYYGIEYLDMRGVGFNSMNQTKYLVDALHPNAAGMDRIANYVNARLRNII